MINHFLSMSQVKSHRLPIEMNDLKTIETLFEEGKSKYLRGEYFDAHEIWEDLWSDYYLIDRKLIQGLIQLCVSLVHLDNGNLKGAKSLLKKSIEKFSQFEKTDRSINLKLLKEDLITLEKEYKSLTRVRDFDWSFVPRIV